MPTPIEFKAPFCPDVFYHIVCKSIDGIVLFNEGKEYKIFRERFGLFTSLCFEIWCYCMLPNHTHHIVRVKSKDIILKNIALLPEKERTNSMNSLIKDTENELLFDTMIERQMNSFLVSYANYCNNKRNRKGGIFQKPFRRIRINDDSHLQQAVIYVHANAQKHKLIGDFKKYPFSSYCEIIIGDDQFVETRKTINFFGSKTEFIIKHKNQVDYYYQNNWPSSKLE